MSKGMDRPQGPAERVPVAGVLAWVDRHVACLPAEEVLAAEAAGRVVAEDVRATIDLPPFDRAAVDGFALRADETVGASSYNPLPFRLAALSEGLPPGSVAPLQAGDPLPRGADAVIHLEHATLGQEGIVEVIEPVVGANEVERAGSHGSRGSTIAAAGRRLGASDIGLLSWAGSARISVVRRPRVSCLLVGRNLVETGRRLAPGEVHDANGPMLRALVRRDGGVTVEQRRIERDRVLLRAAMVAPGADIILVAGGTGPGVDDYAAAALSDAGEVAMHGVALCPGETAGLGRARSGVPVVLLPGSPAACLCAYEFLAGRAIRRLGGRNPELPFAMRLMTAAGKIASEIGMTEVRPVRRLADGTVEPVASFSEAGLTAAAHADGFVIVPEGSEGYGQGVRVPVYMYDAQGLPCA
jgi:molybdopterin molybdotransferase